MFRVSPLAAVAQLAQVNDDAHALGIPGVILLPAWHAPGILTPKRCRRLALPSRVLADGTLVATAV